MTLTPTLEQLEIPFVYTTPGQKFVERKSSANSLDTIPENQSCNIIPFPLDETPDQIQFGGKRKQRKLRDLEEMRKRALEARDPIRYFELCEELGLEDVEDRILYTEGMDEVANFRATHNAPELVEPLPGTSLEAQVQKFLPEAFPQLPNPERSLSDEYLREKELEKTRISDKDKAHQEALKINSIYNAGPEIAKAIHSSIVSHGYPLRGNIQEAKDCFRERGLHHIVVEGNLVSLSNTKERPFVNYVIGLLKKNNLSCSKY